MQSHSHRKIKKEKSVGKYHQNALAAGSFYTNSIICRNVGIL
jgi:hypothetical protein